MITLGMFIWGVFGGLYLVFSSLNNHSSEHIWLGFGIYCILSLISSQIIKSIHQGYLKKPHYGSTINVDNVEKIGYCTFYAISFLLTKILTPILITHNII